MNFLYFIGILIFGKKLHSNLHRKIESLNADLAKMRVELSSLKNNETKSVTNQSATIQSYQPANQFITSEKTDFSTQKTSSNRALTENISMPPIQQYKAPIRHPTTTYPKREYRKETPKKSFRDSEFWKNLEVQFAGNVTGIVGTLAVVLGVIFLGVYAAIQLDPLGRFGVVCMFSLGLYALYFFLSNKTFWKNISLWVRSASGVIFLVGCIGSVGIESMKWVNDPWIGLALLVSGLSANLVLGFLNGGQIFASIHVLFSLLALSLVPVNEITFSIAALVAFVGIVMSFKDRQWDKHLIATTLEFTALHFYWIYSFKSNNQEFPIQSIHAIVLCLIVGATGLISHYRKTYSGASGLQQIPFFAHVITWATLGLNLYAHSKGSVWSTVFLALSVFLSFGMSIKAERMSIQWLYICDRLASLLLALLTVISLKKFGLSGYEISSIAAIVATIFLRIVAQTFEKTIFKISNSAFLFSYLVLAGHTFGLLGESEQVATSSLFMLLCSFLILGFVFPYIQKKAEENNQGFNFTFKQQSYPSTFVEIPLALHGFFALLLATKIKDSEWILVLPLAMTIYNFFLREKLKGLLFDFSILVGTGMTLAVALALILGDSNSLISDTILTVGMLVVGILSFKLSWSEHFKQKITWFGVSIIWLVLMVASYVFTKNISPALTGIIWLLISLCAGELKDREKFCSSNGAHEKSDVFIGLFGIASLFAFLARFFLVDISNEVLAFGMIRIRLFSEFLGLGSIYYWLSISKPSRSVVLKEIVDYFLELFLVVATAIILFEVDSYLHPILWAVGTFACYFLGKKNHQFNRLLLYSYLFYFGSLFYVAFISTTIATPSVLLLDQAWLMGLISVCINTAFMVFAHRDRDSFAKSQLNLPKTVKGLSGFKSFIEKLEVKILLYPLFTAIGFFLLWSFDKTVLSLFWVIECFVLFLISILMREPQFRIVSMVGIGLIFLRIVFYDLTGRDFFIKAVVFISVGLILIAMNTIYNKYKYRYESKQ
ncbi:MAG: hypothetical protein K1X29_07145 [Bdellovibrionales bacterium]|nr:hypothetical protein [Bdellovibrionales bacterium]